MTARRTIERVLMAIGGLAVLFVLMGCVAIATMIRRGVSAREHPSALEAWVASAARSASIPSRAAALRSPLKPTPEVLREARVHWADHCAICHANNGGGDTPMGKNLFPKAPDMRRAPTQELSDGALYFIIKNGIRLTGMPAWGEAGDDDKQSWALVAFIRHLPSLTPEEAAEMSRLNPKSAHELEEHRLEEEFLNEDDQNPGDTP